MSSIRTQKTFFLGQQERGDTYTARLGFVSESNNSKLTNWSKLPIEEFDNVPTDGFVINKVRKGERHDWGRKVDKIRIYDPRGFEIELKVENILRLMMDVGVDKGGLIKEKLVYFWSGHAYPELKLLPESSEEYQRYIQGFKILKTPKKVKNSKIELNTWLLIGRNPTYFSSKKSLVVLTNYGISFNGYGHIKLERNKYNNLNSIYYSGINKTYPTTTKIISNLENKPEFTEFTGLDKINNGLYITSDKKYDVKDLVLFFNDKNISDKNYIGVKIKLKEDNTYLIIKSCGYNLDSNSKYIRTGLLIRQTRDGYQTTDISNNSYYKKYLDNNIELINETLNNFDSLPKNEFGFKFGNECIYRTNI